MKKNKPRTSRTLTRRHLAIIFSLLGLAATLTYGYLRFLRPHAITSIKRTSDKQPWMVIFMHGSFGTMMGLMSMFQVMRDEVENTTYKKMSSHMRHDPFFHQLQAILAPGLHRFTPTFERDSSWAPAQGGGAGVLSGGSSATDYRRAVFPVGAAYQALHNHVRANQEEQYFYTFGWSGLVSQQRRRREAIRFYNMLQQEYNRFVSQGITPKIRLIVHSHGGNVALNMAGIHTLMHTGLATKPDETTHPDKDERESLLALHELLVQLPEKKTVKQRKHQKKWDFMPAVGPLKIDEMILLGMPVQPETVHFFTNPFFKKIYHLYSDGDSVQKMDWVSSNRYYNLLQGEFSAQRLPFTPTNTNPENTIIQAKLTLNKKAPPADSDAPTDKKEKKESKKEEGGVISSVLGALFGSSEKNENPDPAHKELWFMGWKQLAGGNVAQRHIQPYPYVIMVPLIQHLIDKHPDLHDIDVRMKFKDTKVGLICHPHDETTKRHKLYLPREVFTKLQEKATAWEPADVSRGHEMDILHGYTQKIGG